MPPAWSGLEIGIGSLSLGWLGLGFLIWSGLVWDSLASLAGSGHMHWVGGWLALCFVLSDYPFRLLRFCLWDDDRDDHKMSPGDYFLVVGGGLLLVVDRTGNEEDYLTCLHRGRRERVGYHNLIADLDTEVAGG